MRFCFDSIFIFIQCAEQRRGALTLHFRHHIRLVKSFTHICARVFYPSISPKPLARCKTMHIFMANRRSVQFGKIEKDNINYKQKLPFFFKLSIVSTAVDSSPTVNVNYCVMSEKYTILQTQNAQIRQPIVCISHSSHGIRLQGVDLRSACHCSAMIIRALNMLSVTNHSPIPSTKQHAAKIM